MDTRPLAIGSSHTLRAYPELAVFFALAVGFAVGPLEARAASRSAT